MKFRMEFGRLGLASLLLGAAGVWGNAAEPVAELRSFAAPDGETYYSISLTADVPASPRADLDHVLLIDTSASQAGEYRRQTLEVVQNLLQALPAGDRVQVYAVDLAATPLTDGFVAPADALSTAFPILQRRVPAGATDMLGALRTSLAALSAGRAGSIVYIGDGMSSAHLVGADDLRSTTDELRGRAVPVHALAIGPNRDVRLLGVLAERTGGALLIDDWRDDQRRPGAAMGAQLAKALHQPVWYPAGLDTKVEVLPRLAVPVRADRTTVLLGRGELAGRTLTLQASDGESLVWTLPEPRSTTGNTFLLNLWKLTEAQPELGSGLAGDDVLVFAQTAFEDQVQALEAEGYRALQARDYKKAEAIGFAIRSIDPENVRAVGLINGAFEQQQPKLDEVVFLDDAAPEADAPPASPLEGRLIRPVEESAIDRSKARRDALAQKLQGQLEETRAAASQVLKLDPDQALDMLQRMRNTLKAATDISPEARERMLRELNSFENFARSEAQRRTAELQAIQLQERIREAQQELIEHTNLLDERMYQLVDRVRALLSQFREGDDNAAEEAEAVGRLIVNLRPGNPLGMAAVTVSEAAGQLRKASRLRALRADRFLETLYQVELSHVPFPDEPPVRYPPAEVWQALTLRRKQWESTDLKQNNPNEQRIYEALEKKVDIEFIDTELQQAIQFLADRYQIPIIPDTARMEEFGVGLDQQINLVISGISFRSALKLMLEQHDLTYIIEDEVMKITTSEYANQLLQTRVYPVADLVIPIQPIMGGFGGMAMGGGFGGANQFGAGGGMGGGMGGGGGGFGLNVGIGGGGGGGPGIFSVPPESRPAQPPATFNNDTIKALKKKPHQVR